MQRYAYTHDLGDTYAIPSLVHRRPETVIPQKQRAHPVPVICVPKYHSSQGNRALEWLILELGQEITSQAYSRK
jgi:hypothetical protein